MSKYSLPERERRWLVRDIPPDAMRVARIVDRYVDGTRFRLRHVESEPPQFKLGQKVRTDESDPSDLRLTNLYLTAAEFHLLVGRLPSRLLTKTRHRVFHDGLALTIDVFEGELLELVLMEREFGSVEAMAAFTPPGYAGREVTTDTRFSGGALARTSRTELAQLLDATS